MKFYACAKTGLEDKVAQVTFFFNSIDVLFAAYTYFYQHSGMYDAAYAQ